MGLDSEAGLGGRVVDIVKDEVEGTQRTTSPGFADFAKQAVFNGIPLGGAGRIEGPLLSVEELFYKVSFTSDT